MAGTDLCVNKPQQSRSYLNHLVVKRIYFFYNFFLSITILVVTGSRPLNAINFVFCTDIVKPYSVISWFNLCAAFCRLSSVSAIITWSSANNSVDSCWVFESLIPVISCFF
jgi:hypothetical protein